MDVDKLLTELSPEAPCGENLEYDPQFGELERAAEDKPDQQIGDSVVAGEPANWKEVRKLAMGLFERTRDLRIALYLVRAGLHVDGARSLADGLKLLNGLISQHWEHVHPQLDPDDDNDPTWRVNVIAQLKSDDCLRNIRESPIVESKVLGRFSLRDIEIAQGKAPAPDPKEGEEASAPDAAQVDGAFLECDLDELKATAASIHAAVEGITALESSLTEKVGASNSVDLSQVPALLKQIQAILDEKLQARGASGALPAGGAAAAAPAAGGSAAAPPPIQGEIHTREDVLRMIDKMVTYFEKNEPSSPVPLLLLRAKRLVSKNFMDIIRDLAPEGVKPVEKISGTDSK